MLDTPNIEIGDDSIEAYERDGVVCLRGVIAPHWIELLRQGVERDLGEPGPHVEIYTKDGDPGLFFNDFDLWRHNPKMKAFAFEGPCAEIAARLTRSTYINFFYDHVFVKEPGTEGVTHWHQDQPYMAVDGRKLCSNWIPLDPITEETTVEFIRGSHRWGRWFAPFDSMTDGSRYESEAFERFPDIEAHRADYEIVSWELEPGDCIFFHGLMLHQGRSNPTKATRRRTVTHRWLGDDATFAVREPISEFPKIDTQMSHGQPFKDVADFPLVWQKAA
ncbi:MAG: phytanoyl-CoA dioxygenase family protein [Proteobacteria bacterium]|nr:phytanoyl-CoA dioxygenase family protein [Pseudomonadota bacterium]